MAECSTASQVTTPPTVGIIVIGDEILKGKTQDTNGHFISHRLAKLGLKVQQRSILGDSIPSIKEEVRNFSAKYDFVITSGGIGPTHDDVTFQAIADAFEDKLVAHPDLVSFIGNYFKTEDLASPAMKMAHIPSSSTLVYPEDKKTGYKSIYPVISVRNVTVLPGVPKLLEKAFALLDKKLFGEFSPMPSMELYLTSDEVSVAPALNKTVTAFPDLCIGSYPELMHSYYTVQITMEGAKERLEEARSHFTSQLPPGTVLEDFVHDSVADPWTRLQSLLKKKPELKQPVEKAISVLEECLQKYKPSETSVCFNGGKDCLVVLHLYYALLCRDLTTDEKQMGKVQAVYITEENAFPQISQFVERTVNRYNLDCTVLPGPLKSALAELGKTKPDVKAVVMGTRKMDPYSQTLGYFQKTDADWPEFLRVSPILEWDYNTVWEFIRGLYLPYCELYDRGYTSLGNASNTVQNPDLQSKTRLGSVTYLPAYKLQDGTKERNGRL